MATATFRFYEELNDFLPPRQRKRDLTLEFETPVPVRHLLETFGVPHTEVELILLNGESVGLEQQVADGDRVTVYPMFEALDVTPLVRLRERPLRTPRFLADAHLGKLAHYLRMLGFDTLYSNGGDDRELASVAASERRILLSRDRALLMHRQVTHGCYVRHQPPREQLAWIVRRLDLCNATQPFSRCMGCNGLLEPVAKGDIAQRLPEHVAKTQQEFRRCASCGHLYWKGSHYQEMRQWIGGLCPKNGG